jgi:hypothetical protein
MWKCLQQIVIALRFHRDHHRPEGFAIM